MKRLFFEISARSSPRVPRMQRRDVRRHVKRRRPIRSAGDASSTRNATGWHASDHELHGTPLAQGYLGASRSGRSYDIHLCVAGKMSKKEPIFLCNSDRLWQIPYATQFTESSEDRAQRKPVRLDPASSRSEDGLFSPASAEGAVCNARTRTETRSSRFTSSRGSSSRRSNCKIPGRGVSVSASYVKQEWLTACGIKLGPGARL